MYVIKPKLVAMASLCFAVSACDSDSETGATGGSAGASSGGSAGATSGGSAGTASGGSAGIPAGGNAGTASGGNAGTTSGGNAGTTSGGSAGAATGGGGGATGWGCVETATTCACSTTSASSQGSCTGTFNCCYLFDDGCHCLNLSAQQCDQTVKSLKADKVTKCPP